MINKRIKLRYKRDRFSQYNKEIEIKPSPTTGIIKENRIYKYRIDLLIEKENKIPLVVNEEDCTIYLEWKEMSKTIK